MTYKKIYSEGPSSLFSGECISTLDALSKTIEQKVDLVYIDPPFGTNLEFKVSGSGGRTSTMSSQASDVLAYSDTIMGEGYLELIRKSLLGIKKITSESASVYLHIDYKIGHKVKLVMDEVFGEDNFRNDITRIKCNPKNFSRKSFGNIKDMILFYAWGDYTWNNVTIKHSKQDIERLFPKIDSDGRRYTTNPLHAPGETSSGPSGSLWKGIAPPPGRHWRHSPSKLVELEELGLIEWSSTGNPRKIVFADEQSMKGKKVQDIWEFKDPMYPKYPTQKNLELLKFIISTSSNPGDIVLDCFAGSGTTLVAAKELGRNWIGIDQSNEALRVAKERLLEVENRAQNT